MLHAPELAAAPARVLVREPTPSAPAPASPAAERPWEPWVRQARAGDPDAFASLVDEFGPRILAYLHRLTRHPHDAEDLTQETFLKAFRMLPGITSPRAFPAWLFTIARRTALNHLRDVRPTDSLDPEHADPDPSPSDAAAARDAWTRLWSAASRRLSPLQYEVLWLRYAEEMSVRDIARITRCNAIHVRVLLHRGRQALVQLAVRHQLQPPPNP